MVGAAMTPFWYLDRNGATAAANRGGMKEIMLVIAGRPTMAGLNAVWPDIHGDQQMADFERFRALLRDV